MSRKGWIKLLVIVLLAVLIMAAGGFAAFRAYFRYADRRLLTGAQEAEAAGNWRAVKNNCAWYLTRHPQDTAILGKYAEACSLWLDNRNSNVRDAGRAYFQIASKDPAQDDPIVHLIEFQVKHRMWEELEYATSYFLRQRSSNPPGNPSPGLDARLRYLHALALDRSGRTKEAIDAYTELTSSGTDPTVCQSTTDCVDACGGLALLLQQEGLTEQAQTVLKQAQERFPDHAHIFLFRARQSMANRSLAEAEQAFQQALERAPDDVEALVEALDAALKTRRWEAATDYAEKLVKAVPDRQESYLAFAFLLDRKGEADKAIALLSGLDPLVRADNPELFLALAELQVGNNRFEDFTQTLDAYKKSYPEHAAIFDYLAGRELLAKGQAAEAATKLATAVERAPEFVRAQFYEAVAFLHSNQDDLAQGALESYLRSRPDDERAQALWQTRFGGSTTREEAAKTGQDLLANAEAGPYSLVFAARSLMTHASLPDAKETDVQLMNELLERAIKLQPASASAYQALAEFRINRKDLQGARQVLDRAAAASVAKRDLAVLRGAIALAENNLDAAHALLVEDLARPDLTQEDVVRWAQFLASSGYLDKGLEALDLGAARMIPEKRCQLELEQVGLATRYGTADRAMEILQKVEPSLDKTPATTKRLHQEKISLARALLGADAPDPQGSKEKALGLLADIETEEPTNAGARVLRANLMLKQDPPDYAGAESIISSVLESYPSDVDALALMSEIASGAGRPGQALDYAQRAAAASPPGAQAQLVLADAQLHVQRYREAQETLQRYLIARPNGMRAMEMLVRAYGEQGKAAEARATFDRIEKALANDPENAKVIAQLRGWLAGYEGDWQEAERTLRARYDANPDGMTDVQALAAALVKLNRVDEAEQIMKEYAQRKHDRPEAWTFLGQFYLSRGLSNHSLSNNDKLFDKLRGAERYLAQASSAFTQASLLVPDYGPALRGLIEVQVRGNNRGMALSLCERYLALQPDDVDILYRKAALLGQDRNRLDEALQTINRALQISERAEFLLARGSIHLAQKKFNEALKDFQRYAELTGSTSAEEDTAMAEIYLALHEKDLARQYYESAKQKAAKEQKTDTARLDLLGRRLAEESQQP